MIDNWMVVPVIVIVHVVMVYQDYRGVEVVIVTIEASIRIVGTVGRHGGCTIGSRRCRGSYCAIITI